jgi:protein transport protein SEC61 subunit gamma-like protein
VNKLAKNKDGNNSKNIKNNKSKSVMLSKLEEFKAFINQCKRVMMITRRPSRDEFLMVSKVTGLGICLLGALGFAIHAPMMYLKAMLKP